MKVPNVRNNHFNTSLKTQLHFPSPFVSPTTDLCSEWAMIQCNFTESTKCPFSCERIFSNPDNPISGLGSVLIHTFYFSRPCKLSIQPTF